MTRKPESQPRDHESDFPRRSLQAIPNPLTAVIGPIGRPSNEFLYLADKSLATSYVTVNVKDVLGITAERFVDSPSIWKEIIPEYDQSKVIGKLRQLDVKNEVSFMHRVLNHAGMPLWVSHRGMIVEVGQASMIWGCISKIDAGDELFSWLEADVVSEFVHKLGNHFQLLTLAVNSLLKEPFEATEINGVRESIERSVSFSRRFSEFIQMPCFENRVNLAEIIERVMINQEPCIREKSLNVQSDYSSEVSALSFSGDAYLLELAMGALLQNAIEATETGGKITVQIRGAQAGLSVIVTDRGVGIQERDLTKVFQPFFSTKAGHDGLGLSLALRFIELHRGRVWLKSAINEGTEVQVLLPRNEKCP